MCVKNSKIKQKVIQGYSARNWLIQGQQPVETLDLRIVVENKIVVNALYIFMGFFSDCTTLIGI